jgi:hypothetical protein
MKPPLQMGRTVSPNHFFSKYSLDEQSSLKVPAFENDFRIKIVLLEYPEEEFLSVNCSLLVCPEFQINISGVIFQPHSSLYKTEP